MHYKDAQHKWKEVRHKTALLTQNEENQERYREQIKQEMEGSEYVAAQQEYKWEKLKDINIKCAAETRFGYKKKANEMTTRYQIQTLKGCQKNIRT